MSLLFTALLWAVGAMIALVTLSAVRSVAARPFWELQTGTRLVQVDVEERRMQSLRFVGQDRRKAGAAAAQESQHQALAA